jgi:hypothetical protein
MDQPRPEVERVKSGRSTPLAVGLAAIALTALLIWKPWDAPRPTVPASPAAAVATPTATSPSPRPSGEPSAQPRPLPTPDIGGVTPITEFALVQRPGEAFVSCSYSRLRDGRRFLRSLEIQPPVVPSLQRGDPRDIRQVAWHVELQENRLDRLFDREWVRVAESRSQQGAVSSSRPTSFGPLTMDYGASRDQETSVFRVVVVVEWLTRNLELAGRGSVLAPSYLEASDPVTEIRTEGCRAVRETGRGSQPVPEVADVAVTFASTPVTCVYGGTVDVTRRLTAMVVPPPSVDVRDAVASQIRYVGWWFTVESGTPRPNAVDGEELEWERSYQGPPIINDSDPPTAFDPFPVPIPLGDARATDRFRVTVVVEWYGPATTPVDHVEVLAEDYLVAGERQKVGCPGTI